MKNDCVITVNAFDEQSIEQAISEIKKYKKWLSEKMHEFVKTLAQEGVKIASVEFSNAVYDGTNDVSCSVRENGKNKFAVLAVGNATLFIEFGTGIRYPDNHPEAAKNGMVRGRYGHRLGGLKNGWRYQGDPGTNGQVISTGKNRGMVHTYGNPANKCMYKTARELERKFEETARRVFR